MNISDASSSSSSVFANFLARPLSSSGRIIISNRQKRRLSLTMHVLKEDNDNSDKRALTVEGKDVLVGMADSKVVNKLTPDFTTNNNDINNNNQEENYSKNKVNMACRRSSINVAREFWGDMGAADGISPETLAALSGSRHGQQVQDFSTAKSSAMTIGHVEAATSRDNIQTQKLCMVSDDDEEDDASDFKSDGETYSCPTKMSSTESHTPSPKTLLRAKIDEMSWQLVRTMERTGQSRVLVQNRAHMKHSFLSDDDQSHPPSSKKRRCHADLADRPEGLWRHFAADFFSDE